MTQTPAAQGWFVAIVGPSGAGKDTILRGAQSALAENETFCFPQRMITRSEGDENEDHTALSEADFLAAQQAGNFCVSWSAHGLHYGIGRSAHTKIASGHIVVANVSRSALDTLRDIFEHVRVVQITVDRAVLATRLRSRGRESESEITSRLSRTNRYSVKGADVVTLDNSGDPKIAISGLVEVLNSLAPRP